MPFNRNALVQDIFTDLGQAGAGVARSEIEEIVYNLVGDGITSFPKAAVFLARFPKLSRRVGAVALLNILKARPNIFGAEYAPYVRAMNEVIESFAEGAGRAVADITEDQGREMAVKVTTISESGVVVFNDTAHRGDGNCVNLKAKQLEWSRDHPPKSRRVGSGPNSKTVTDPGEPFPEILLTLAEAVDQDATPCPKCMKNHIVKPAWAKPTDPPKPKPFEDTLSKKERWVFGRLCDRAMSEKGLAAALVQRAFEEDAWGKVRLLKDILNEGEKNKEPDDVLYRRFVRRVDAVFNPRLKDRLAGHLDAALDKVFRWISERNWWAVILVVLGIVSIALAVVVVTGLLYLAFTGWAAKLFFVDGWYHGRFWQWMIGSGLLFISMGLLFPLQGFADWFMDQFRIVGQRLGFNVTPATTSVPWLRNLGFSGAFSALFWGAIGMITVGLAGGIKARAILVIAAMFSTAAAVGYAQVRRMDLWEKGFLRTVALVGLIPTFLMTAAVMTTTEWNWEPMQAAAVQGTTNQYVVVYPNPYDPNPYDQTDDGEYSLEQVFGVAATKYGMVWVNNNQVYSRVRLVADIPGALEVRPREDGFGRFIYDLKPDRFPEELDRAKARAEQAKQLAAVVNLNGASGGNAHWWLLPVVLLGLAIAAFFAKIFLQDPVDGYGRRIPSRLKAVLTLGGSLALVAAVIWLIVAGINHHDAEKSISMAVHHRQLATEQVEAPAAPTVTVIRRAAPAAATPSPKSKDMGTRIVTSSNHRHYSRETCLRLPHTGLRAECLSKVR